MCPRDQHILVWKIEGAAFQVEAQKCGYGGGGEGQGWGGAWQGWEGCGKTEEGRGKAGGGVARLGGEVWKGLGSGFWVGTQGFVFFKLMF